MADRRVTDPLQQQYETVQIVRGPFPVIGHVELPWKRGNHQKDSAGG